MAPAPRNSAAMRAIRTCSRSSGVFPMTVVTRSRATAPLPASTSPLTVPSTVKNATLEISAKSTLPKLRARSGAAMLLSEVSSMPPVMAPSPR